MTHEDDMNEEGSGVELASDGGGLVHDPGPNAPLISHHEDRTKISSPEMIRREVKLLEHEHELLRKVAQRHGKPMTTIMRDMMLRGLKLQDEIDNGRDVAVMQGRHILFKIF